MAHLQKVYPRSCDRCVARNGVITHYEVRWAEPVYPKGKRYRQETFHTRKEALARKSAVEDERATTGRVRDASVAEVPFGQVAQDWLDAMTPRIASGKLKPRTREEYAGILARYVLPRWAAVPVGAITSQACEAWARELTGRGLKPRTYRHAWAAFNRVLKYATRHDILTANPADKVDVSSGVSKAGDEFEGVALTAEQVGAVVQHVQATYPVYGVAVLLLAYTGLRASELAGLNIGDLILNGNTGSVRVQRTRRKKKGGWVVDTPKSRASRRVIPLDGWLAELLTVYLRETHPHGDSKDAPLFPHRHVGRGHKLDWSQPIEPNSFYRNVFIPAVKAAGLPPTRLHDLRHTFATLQLRAGPPDHYMQVSVWLGHADYAVTLRVYAHVIPHSGMGKIHQLPPPPVSSHPNSVQFVRSSDEPEAGTVVQFRPRRSG